MSCNLNTAVAKHVTPCDVCRKEQFHRSLLSLSLYPPNTSPCASNPAKLLRLHSPARDAFYFGATRGKVRPVFIMRNIWWLRGKRDVRAAGVHFRICRRHCYKHTHTPSREEVVHRKKGRPDLCLA